MCCVGEDQGQSPRKLCEGHRSIVRKQYMVWKYAHTALGRRPGATSSYLTQGQARPYGQQGQEKDGECQLGAQGLWSAGAMAALCCGVRVAGRGAGLKVTLIGGNVGTRGTRAK